MGRWGLAFALQAPLLSLCATEQFQAAAVGASRCSAELPAQCDEGEGDEGEGGQALSMLQRKSARLRDQRRSRASEADDKAPPLSSPCLCLFDTDRTLTAIQEYQYGAPYRRLNFPNRGYEAIDAKCPGTIHQPMAHDSAYPMNSSEPTNMLRLSSFMARFGETFCSKKCYKGILSVGSLGGESVSKDGASGYLRMVETLEFFLNEGPTHLRLPCTDPNSPGGKTECSMNAVDALNASIEEMRPLIINIGAACQKKNKLLGRFSGACKVDFVQNVTAYYKHRVGVTIPDEQVYFFDDACVNVAAFKGTKYHARQISCGRRQCWQEPPDAPDVNHNLGVCGATVYEVEAALTGPRQYLCSVDDNGSCDALYGCGDYRDAVIKKA